MIGYNGIFRNKKTRCRSANSLWTQKKDKNVSIACCWFLKTCPLLGRLVTGRFTWVLQPDQVLLEMQTSFCLGINIFVLFTGWWGSKEWVVCSFFSNNVALPWKHSSLDQTQGFPLVEASWRAELHTQNLPDGLYQTLHGVFPLWWITRLDRWNELLPNHRASESLPAVIVRQREDLTLASSSTAGLKLISLKGKKNKETPDIWTHVGAAACDSSR